jgi:ElaB/YqjD/DUF883 family membrane-anchored ribosome-binding protein
MSNRDARYGDLTGSGSDPFGTPDQDKTQQAKDKGKQATDSAKEKGQEARDQGEQALGTAKDKASEMSGKAHAGADEGLNKASAGLDSAADKLREQGDQQGGAMGSAATTTADTLESASGYLREKDTDQLVDDIEAFIRRKPTESLLIAAGIGFILSKVFR